MQKTVLPFMIKLLFTMFFVFILNYCCLSQAYSSFNCKFLNQIFNYIEHQHAERLKALKKIGGVVEYSHGRKNNKYIK